LGGVNCLDQAIDIGRHDEQIAERLGIRIPVSVRGAPRYEHRRARAGLDFIFPSLYAQGAFHDVPGLVVVLMQVERSDPTRRSWRRTGIAPFGDHERIIRRAENIAGKRRCKGVWRHDGIAAQISGALARAKARSSFFEEVEGALELELELGAFG
jgi:hypothetical protein